MDTKLLKYKKAVHHFSNS